jgi:hypothetical protein
VREGELASAIEVFWSGGGGGGGGDDSSSSDEEQPSSSVVERGDGDAGAPPLSLKGSASRNLLERLKAHGQADLAWKLYTALRQTSRAMHAQDYSHFLHVLGNVKSVSLAKRAKLVEADMVRAGAYDPLDFAQTTALVRACSHADDLQGACAFYERSLAAAARAALPGAPGRLPIWVDIAYLSACAHAGEAGRARAVYDVRGFGEMLGPADTREHRTGAQALSLLMNTYARGEV